MLTLNAVNQFYGESHILWDAQLQLAPGTCTCLMGRNGVGKSTLLKCVMGCCPSQVDPLLWVQLICHASRLTCVRKRA